MDKMSDKVYNYISEDSNYDIDELMEHFEKKVKSYSRKFTGLTLDECNIYYGNGNDSYVSDLETYTKDMFKIACELVVNVIQSFEGDDNE